MYSYDTNLTEIKDKVRFYIQDNKEEDYFFEDEEINAILKIYNNNINRTVTELCYTLAALFSAEADSEQVGPYSVSYKSLSDKYLNIAEVFRRKSFRVLGGYAGGISRVDAEISRQNPDIIKSAFTRNMMKNRRVNPMLPNWEGE